MNLQLWAVINLTPDSFYSKSRFHEKSFLPYVQEVLNSGADILDIGAESTRPFSKEISAQEEWSRLGGCLYALKKEYGEDFLSRFVSVDTRKPEIARKSIGLGVGIINDTSGLDSQDMIQVIAESHSKVVIMHSQGRPRDMQIRPKYKNVVSEALLFLKNRSIQATKCGILPKNIIWDYGIGFGKEVDHNLQLIYHTKEFQKFGYPLMAGLSRKSFIGKLLNLDDPAERGAGSMALHSFLALQGVDILRVHDVKETNQMRLLFQSLNALPELKSYL